MHEPDRDKSVGLRRDDALAVAQHVTDAMRHRCLVAGAARQLDRLRSKRKDDEVLFCDDDDRKSDCTIANDMPPTASPPTSPDAAACALLTAAADGWFKNIA